MLTLIYKLLSSDHYLNVSERVEFAKGSDKLETSIRGNWNQAKRKQGWR